MRLLDRTAPAKHAATLRFLEWFRGGYRTEHVKQRGVCRDLQIEIKKAVHQDSHATEQRGDGQCAGGVLGPILILKLGRGLAENQHQEPDCDGESGQAGFDQQLQIIIVGLVHEEVGVETAKFRVGGGKGAQSPAENGPLHQHVQAVAINGQAKPTVDLFTGFGVNAGQAAGGRGGWNFIADFRPTLLIFDDGESREVKAALRTSSFRGLVSLDARGISNFCASKVVFSLSSVVDPCLIESAVQINLDLAAPKANLLSDFELNRLSAEFQPLLLAYRIANWLRVLESEFDVPEFTFPSRAIASALGDCVGGDRDLQTRYVSLMRWQDDAARAARSVSPESCLTEVLLRIVHLDPTIESFQPECLYVQDVAKSLNTLLRQRGVLEQYSPPEVGWMLKDLCIPKVPRDNAGVKIALGKETSSRVHALARRFDVPLTEARGECPECAGRPLGVGV